MAMGSCTYTQIHTLFAMHNSVVSLFLCSVTRDGEQRAEQGDFIIPTVFILHPTDLCTFHPSFPFSFHFFMISLQPSPIYTYLILSGFKNLTLFLILYFTIFFFFHYSIRVPLRLSHLLFFHFILPEALVLIFFLFCCFLLHFFALYFSWSCRESGEQESLPVGWFLTKHKAFFSFDLVMLCLLTFFLFVSFFLFIHFLKIFSHFVQLWLFTSN